MAQVYFEDVQPGDEIGPLVKQPTRDEVRAFSKLTQLAGRFVSDEGAREEGLERMIIPSWQSMAFLSQLITDWMGPLGFLSRFDVYFRRVVEPGDCLECRALVTDAQVRDGAHLVLMDAYMENQKGERPLQGTAEVVLPSRI